MALLYLAQNRGRRLRPDKRFGVLVVVGNERDDRPLKFSDATERATADALFRNFGKEPFDGIEPRRTCRREMNVIARSRFEPRFNEWMFVRRVIIHNEMHVELRRHAALDAIEKLHEFGMPVTRQALFDDLPRKDVQRRKQRRGTVANVVVRLRGGHSWAQRQNRSGSIQRLDAAFFIDAQDDRVYRRVHVQAHDVPQLRRKIRILTELEGAYAVRLQVMRKQNPLNCASANVIFRSQRSRSPMRCVLWSRGHDRLRQPLDGLISDDSGSARSLTIRKHALDTKGREAIADLHDAVTRDTDPLRNLDVRQTFGRIENDLRTHHRTLRRCWPPRQLNQNTTIFGTNGEARCRAIRHASIVPH